MMPLPKPLPKSAPKAKKKAVVAKTMADLKAGPKHGERTHKQEVAIALKTSGGAKSGGAASSEKPAGSKRTWSPKPSNADDKAANRMAGLGKGIENARTRARKAPYRRKRNSGKS